jgi:LPS-assembly protein
MKRCILFFVIFILYPASYGWAGTQITADFMEHFAEEDKYVAIGNVRIEKEGTVITADRAVLYQKTSIADLSGRVIYEDADTVINTERAELNLDTKSGKLHNAIIFFKADNFWINGKNVEKIKENHYYAKTATFTSCNSDAFLNPEKLSSEKIFGEHTPDWCFKGSNVDVIVGSYMTAANATYRVKGLPVLYSPYMSAPVKTERETGFLIPVIGNSSTKGFQFSPAFFWAIDDNKDATFYLDYFSKRGIGKGVEYRYLDFDNSGRLYGYHLKDKDLERNIYELKATHDHKFKTARGYLDFNYVNYMDYYKEYAYKRANRIQRFLQSSGEVSMPLRDSRVYLLGQYWIDLQDKEAHIPHRLSELGYVMNPASVGPLMLTMSSNISNFYRKEEARGQRLDINPTLSYAFGNWMQVFQSISPRLSAYKLENAGTYKSSSHRETFEYRAKALTRFSRQYESFNHIIEPTLEYRFIPETHPMPLFDSVEMFDKTSVAELGFLNIFSFRAFSISARLVQPYDFNAGDRPLSPTRLAGSFSGPFNLTFDVARNFNNGRIETINSEVSARIADKTSITAGERYSRDGKPMLYKVGVDSALSKKWSVNADIWYNSGGGLRESTLKATYKQQCWTANVALSRKPGYTARQGYATHPPEYSFMIFIELRGLGTLKLL